MSSLIIRNNTRFKLGHIFIIIFHLFKNDASTTVFSGFVVLEVILVLMNTQLQHLEAFEEGLILKQHTILLV